MDIRSIEDVPASPEHQGTVPVWWLFKPREMRDETLGGHLELVSEFEVMGGGEVHPHHHPTYEFYYVLVRPRRDDHRERDPRDPPGRSREDTAERNSQLEARQPQRVDPVPRFRGRGEGRAGDRLFVRIAPRRTGSKLVDDNKRTGHMKQCLHGRDRRIRPGRFVSAGLYRSADRTDAWERIAAGFHRLPEVHAILIDPARPERSLSATQSGIFRSEDLGDGWRQLRCARAGTRGLVARPAT